MNLFFSLILNRFSLLFKSFSQWRICKLSFFYYLSLIKRQYLYTYIHNIYIHIYIIYILYIYIIYIYIYFIYIFFLKRKELSDARVVSINNKKWFCSTLFIKIHKVFKVTIWWMIKCKLLKLFFVWSYHNKIVCWI